MKNELVSIIVPIYNVEKYLKKCIDSIINQSYKNTEIILVDDGSKDSCPLICDEYLKKDSRIKVIHKKNGGLSDARNAGIKIARGKYITFVDSDDYISNLFVENLCREANNNNSDIVCCGLKAFHEDNKIIECKITNNFKQLSNIEALSNMMYQKSIVNCACAKIYKTSLFDNIEFPVGKICEDLATTYKLFYKAKSISFTNDNYYFYLQRHDSIIHNDFNIKRMAGLDFAIEQTNFINDKCPNLSKAAINREFMECFYILKVIPFDEKFEKELNKIRNVIKKRRWVIIYDLKASLKSKILAFVSLFSLKICKKILNSR